MRRPLDVLAVSFDLDGTLYAGGRVLPGALAAVRSVVSAGMKALYLTNASGRTREEIRADLEEMGFPVGEQAVWTSATTTAAWLAQRAIGSVAMLGTQGLRIELEAVGMAVVGQADPCDALVVGLDRGFDFSRQRPIDDGLADRLGRVEALLVVCNRDDAFPGPDGNPQLGCGRLAALVEHQCGRKADAAPGKPQPDMLLDASAAHGMDPRRVLVVGDSAVSDAGMAHAAGAPCALVPASAALASSQAPETADAFIMPGIWALPELLGLDAVP